MTGHLYPDCRANNPVQIVDFMPPVRGMWLALLHTMPDDFIFATGKLHRIQDIIELAFRASGLDRRDYVRQEKQYFRPADPRQVVGNATKAKAVLGWQPEISFEQTIAEMVQAELVAFGV